MLRVIKLSVLTLALALALALLISTPTQAQSTVSYTAKPLCLPGAYPVDQIDCLALGPSTRLTEMANVGLTVPVRPLPAVKPDPALNTSPVSIARINLDATEKAPLYTTFEDATQQVNPVRYID